MKFENLAEVYANAIKTSDRTLDEVPAFLRAAVDEKLKEDAENA